MKGRSSQASARLISDTERAREIQLALFAFLKAAGKGFIHSFESAAYVWDHESIRRPTPR